MTVPRHTSDLLIEPPSLSLTPSAPVALARSLSKKREERGDLCSMVYITCRQGQPNATLILSHLALHTPVLPEDIISTQSQ